MEEPASFPQGRRVTRTPAPWDRLHGDRDLLPAGCRCPAGGPGMVWAFSGRERMPGPREDPVKIPSPGPRGSSGLPRLLPWGMVLLKEALVSRR